MSEQEKTRGELPRDEGTARPASPKHAPRVLIVDDEEGMRNYLSVVLRKAGFATADAADGQAGYDMLTRQPFDVVLEDLKMPRLDGIAATRPDTVCASGSGVIGLLRAVSTQSRL